MREGATFEPIPGARHRVETIDGVEWIVARASRNWFVLLFLGFWLTLWTFGGLAAMAAAASGEEPVVFVWLVFWAAAWVFVAATVGWQLAGRTLVSVNGGALAYRWTMPVVTRTRRYDPAQVRHLRAASVALPFGNAWMRSAYPPFLNGAAGSVQFDYGARTIRLMPGLDEAEGRMVVEWLARRLPAGAVDGQR
jgi:hypothetical protein